LHLKPTRIASKVEYEKYFGKAQPEVDINVAITETQDSVGNTLTLNAVASLTEAARSNHIMYYALQMFFANGGVACYIVSVGLYKTLGGL
jgi:phage tail sheath protein FI